MWLLFAAAAGLSPATEPAHYKSMTETEYAIELTLGAKGQALFEFDWWAADNSVRPTHEELAGTWSKEGSLIKMQLASGASVTYKQDPCLSYQEFDHQGCSPGLELVSTDLSPRYELQRFGLWDSRLLRVEP